MNLVGNKIKVCFLTHNLKQDNGAGVFSGRLINGLKEKHGIQPTVFTYPISFWKLRRAIKNCDIVHALDVWPYAVFGYLASWGLKKKFIITAVGSGSILPLYNPWQFWITRRAYRAADKVTAVSDFTKREILKKVPGLKIDVITHGVDFKKFNGERWSILPTAQVLQDLAQTDGASRAIPQQRDMRVFAKFGAEATESACPYILSVGTIRWRKGYHRSIPAFAKVAKIFPHLNYVIVGKRHKDDYDNRLRELVKSLGLEAKVIIVDNLDNSEDLVRFYQNAELFCLMSQTANRDLEGFGLVFLEAAAARLPVVGTSGSGTEDAVLDGKNGFLVDPLDVDAFAEAIISILKNPNAKIQMSNQSVNFAKNSDWSGKIKQYADLYAHL